MPPANEPFTIALLVSGNGSNLQAMIDRIEKGSINAAIACVISDKADAYALERAKNHNITTIIHENQGYQNRREYDKALLEILKNHNVELIVLAGFMRLLTDVIINAFPNAIINIHPALLPSFPGLHAQRQALEYGVRFSGCTVHFVDCGTDTGPIILQSIVPVEKEDTVETLTERILEQEHRILPEAVRLFSQRRISLQGRHVLIS